MRWRSKASKGWSSSGMKEKEISFRADLKEQIDVS